MIETIAGAIDTANPCVLWSNALGRADMVASSAAVDGAVANILGPQTFDYWTPAAMPATVTATLIAAELIDCFAFAAHNLGSRGATVLAEYSTGTATAWLPLVTVGPMDDDTFMAVFPAVSARRVRFTFSGALVPSIGVAMVGRRLVIPTGIQSPYTPSDRARRVDVMGGGTLGGQFLGNSVRRRGIDLSVRFTPVQRDWVDTALPAFAAHYDAGGAFIWAGSPAFLPNDCAYAWRADGAGELRPALQAGGRWVDMGMELSAYGA